REPFTRIMAAREALPAGGVLRVRAIFEPVPLYRVMQRHGFAHWTEELAADDWRVWFWREGEAQALAVTADATNSAAAEAHDSGSRDRSEEHTSELQSRENLVCRLLLEKKKQLEG